MVSQHETGKGAEGEERTPWGRVWGAAFSLGQGQLEQASTEKMQIPAS